MTADSAPAAALVTAIAVFPACASVDVTPASIRAADVPEAERAEVLARWRESVEIANEFLVSPFRRTLPEGRFELDDGAGLSFVSTAGAWPIRVRCTGWGDLCLALGFQAQEREDGFVVGRVTPRRDRRVDNALFRIRGGEALGAESMARLTLHETTHVVYRDGTTGFWNGLGYYLEAIFTLSSAAHSAEHRPHATSHEFAFFVLQRGDADELSRATMLAAFEEHVARPGGRACRHGLDEAELAPPGR